MSNGATRIYRDALAEEHRQTLVMENLSFVKHIFGRIVGNLPSNIDTDNLESAGVLGLVEASHQYDPDVGVEFRAFAYHRVRGAIIDELRRNSPLPQRLMNQIGLVRKAEQQLEPPHSVERLAEYTGLSIDEVDDCLKAIRLTRPSPLTDESLSLLHDRRSGFVGQQLEHNEKKRLLADCIAQLPDQQRIVLSLYYSEDLRLKEIGQVLHLSESRISRVLAKAEEALRQMIHASPEEK